MFQDQAFGSRQTWHNFLKALDIIEKTEVTALQSFPALAIRFKKHYYDLRKTVFSKIMLTFFEEVAAE